MGKAIAPRTGAAQSTRARVPPRPAAPVPGNTSDGGLPEEPEISLDLV